ncbi:MAG: hypothetical protein ACFBSF_15460 [Leptolyngbyaceae cyanobacterium]
MRLPDFVNQIRRKFSEVTNFVRHPDQVIYRQGRRVALQKYEQLSLPGSSNKPGNSEKKAGTAAKENGRSHPTMVGLTRSKSAAAQPGAMAASVALAPTPPPSASVDPAALAAPEGSRLQPGEVLTRGWVGRYVMGTCLQDDGWMRLYEGVQENSSEPVWIYEYRLSETVFNGRDQQSRRTAFKQVIDLNSRLGEGSDFRILKLRDVITAAQQPCYLITQSLPRGRCLSEYLADRGYPFAPEQVREFLRQVLQSLQYLQAYQVHWPQGSSQMGLPHGHLTLESVWIRFAETRSPGQADTFFVYLSRLALWEHLFYEGDPPLQEIAQTSQALGTIADDLSDLGNMAFTLLMGDSQSDPSDLQAWPDDPQVQSLYPFICRLMGQGPEEPFRSPDTAIAALKTLPSTLVLPAEHEVPDVSASEVVVSAGRSWGVWPWLLAGLAMLGSGLLIGRLISGRASNFAGPDHTCHESDECVLQLGSFDGAGTIAYQFEPSSYWADIFSRSLASPAMRASSFLLEESLESRTGASESTLVKAASVPRDRATLLEQIQQGQLQAGFIRGRQALPEGVAATTVGYDGIAIFVIHSDAHRDRNIPKLLDGQITKEDLQKLFTQQTTVIGKKQLPVKIYFPQGYNRSAEDAAATIQLFRELVFEDATDQAQFDAVQRQALQGIQDLDEQPGSIYAHMLDDFEIQAADLDGETNGHPEIGIGFDRISRLKGQCSVYPLALTDDDGKTYPVFVGTEGTPIDLNTDLCGDKGTYWVNSKIFEASGNNRDANDPDQVPYPLGYAMAVAYPEDCTVSTPDTDCQTPGESLAQQLLSLEGQYLLSEVGLVPVKPIERIRHFLWSGNHVNQ